MKQVIFILIGIMVVSIFIGIFRNLWLEIAYQIDKNLINQKEKLQGKIIADQFLKDFLIQKKADWLNCVNNYSGLVFEGETLVRCFIGTKGYDRFTDSDWQTLFQLKAMSCFLCGSARARRA